MISTNGNPVTRSATWFGGPEMILLYDRFFYPEHPEGWKNIGGPDGVDRMFEYDWDDRGNVYLAAGPFMWGIVKDDGKAGGGILPTLYHHGNPTDAEVGNPMVIMSVKTSSGAYYAVVSGGQSGEPTDIFDVNDPAKPKNERTIPVSARSPMVYWAKSSDGTRIATLDNEYAVSIYTNDSIITNGPPLAKFKGSYRSLTTDGTKFYASSVTGSGDLRITAVFVVRFGVLGDNPFR